MARSRARYHLRPSQVSLRHRLDSVLGSVFRDTPDILDGAEIPDHEEICIRALTVRVPMRLGASDSALTRVWSEAISSAIAREIRESAVQGIDPPVVRYRSRSHAVLDLIGSVSSGERSRAWAWTQMGLLPQGPESEAPAIVVDALLVEPEKIISILGEVARSGRFGWLDATFTARDWWSLAAAALAASGISTAPLRLLQTHLPGPARARAPIVARNSGIFRSARGAREHDFARERGPMALAILAVLEAEPGLMVYDPPRGFEVVRAVTDLWQRDADLVSESDSRRSQAYAGSSAADASARSGMLESPPAPTLAFEPPVAATEWAGLVFLLRLVDRLDLAARAIEDARFRRRSLRWVLHQLAQALAPVAADDPAGLAFAGLPPGSSRPDADLDPPDAGELAAVVDLRGRIAAGLLEMLERPVDEEQATLAEITHREGRIEGGPGWIVVHLRLSSTVVEVRRTGLDLDPGFIPWLGVGLRFAYD